MLIIQRRYGISEIFVNIIKKVYEGKCYVLDDGNISEQFEVKSGVK